MDGWVIKGVSKVAIAYKSHLHRYNSYTESYYLITLWGINVSLRNCAGFCIRLLKGVAGDLIAQPPAPQIAARHPICSFVG